MAATIDDIARFAGVGRSTVCRALRNETRISTETRERILKIAEELEYRPNRIALSLSLGKSRLVGVLVTPTAVPVFNTLIEPIEKGLRSAGYSILFCSSSGDSETELATVDQMIDNHVDGVIIHPRISKPDPEIYRKLIKSGAKVVVIDRFVEGLDTPQIIVNDYQASRLATEYLISMGHRKIGDLSIPISEYAGRMRLRGYRDALNAAGIPDNDSYVVEVQLGHEDGATAMAELLQVKDRPTAVIARHDYVAIGAMRAIREAGLRIPEDISIMGAGDCWYDDMLCVPLTSLHYPYDELARSAIDVLLPMLGGESVESTVRVLDVSLVERSSCAPPHEM
ncbi:MAG TPA: LacI family DNA-binding transcriptional regulator [Armatimonadota bacterium]|jgi:DNA-binding LacI/PurR family transcriptional regulator